MWSLDLKGSIPIEFRRSINLLPNPYIDHSILDQILDREHGDLLDSNMSKGRAIQPGNHHKLYGAHIRI